GDTAPMAVNGTDFGSLDTIASVSHIFTIMNAGTATLNVGSIAITGAHAADFTITQYPPATLAMSASANFQVQFHPSASGARAATVTLTGNDADEPTYAFAIGGTGLPAHAEIAIYPPAIQRSIHAGNSVVETLQISAPGSGALDYSIASS